ncbi:MAG TPA: isoleucine--tRNA ligase [Thermoleophilia bacterium]|nr:isoleucine--tRNA ligase [Thermoleophilia bacterium]
MSDKHPLFRDVSARVDLPALDARILAFWKERGIFEKSLEGRDDAPVYVFYEGPPTANGRPGAHHVISRIFKDLFPRYKTMRGYRVPRKAGWDTHGLPVELEVERRLGIDGKGQIEEYGVAEFNKLCRESVTAYLEEWERFTERIGFWVDLEDAYYTFTNEYIETVWWLLRQIWDKDLLYQGFKVVPYCPRCGTAISSHEVAQGYKDVTEDSVYVRFPLAPEAAALVAGEPGKAVSLAVWTTTPWTLISNVAAAVHPEVTYALVESRGERFVLARELVEKVLGKKAVVEREFPGAELLGLDYEPPFDFMTPDKRAHFVIGADYVTTTDGTGIVHIAPAFGEDDMRVGQENDLPIVNAVDTEGKFIAEVTPWAGVFVKDADPAITADLKERGLLLGVEPYEHSYPFCWRCDTALLYYAKATWYVRTTAIKDELIAANEDVVWHPEHIKNGRFGEWLANNVDWALSRDRYWGTPLPVWRCEEGHAHCVGSIAELRERAAGPVPEDLELHRPFVDDVVLTCAECGGEMRRVPEVIDAWFDSGSMPFAQWHYPFENEDKFRERFPADFIAEAIDQTRGWFYSLLAVATLIEGRSSYKRVLCLGHILDGDGQKMSKSKGNVVHPDDILDHQGADAFRWFMFSSQQPWSPRRFSADMVDEVVRKFLLTLWNTYSFFTVYANIDRFDPAANVVPLEERPLLDRWLVGELNTLIQTVTDGLEAYDATGTCRAIQEFVDDLSNWYVRRSRRRFWKSESDSDKLAAYHTLHEALVTVTKLLAPFTPFIAEELYQNLVRSADPAVPESVHLCAWPVADEAAIDAGVSFDMAAARRVVEMGRAARNAAAVKTRQPLAEVVVALPEAEARAVEGLRDVVRDELNVKELRVVADGDELVAYTVKPNLRLLGPKLGKRLGALQAALKEADAAALVAELKAEGSVALALADGELRLAEEELLVETGSPDGYQVESEAGRVVALKTAVDDALREEGVAREIVHAIQLARKNADLRIEDTIRLALTVPVELAPVVGHYEGTIKAETLASELVLGAADGDHQETARVEGRELGIGLTVTGTLFTVTYG